MDQNKGNIQSAVSTEEMMRQFEQGQGNLYGGRMTADRRHEVRVRMGRHSAMESIHKALEQDHFVRVPEARLGLARMEGTAKP